MFIIQSHGQLPDNDKSKRSDMHHVNDHTSQSEDDYSEHGSGSVTRSLWGEVSESTPIAPAGKRSEREFGEDSSASKRSTGASSTSQNTQITSWEQTLAASSGAAGVKKSAPKLSFFFDDDDDPEAASKDLANDPIYQRVNYNKSNGGASYSSASDMNFSCEYCYRWSFMINPEQIMHCVITLPPITLPLPISQFYHLISICPCTNLSLLAVGPDVIGRVSSLLSSGSSSLASSSSALVSSVSSKAAGLFYSSSSFSFSTQEHTLSASDSNRTISSSTGNTATMRRHIASSTGASLLPTHTAPSRGTPSGDNSLRSASVRLFLPFELPSTFY
jgi:hypothetical protein